MLASTAQLAGGCWSAGCNSLVAADWGVVIGRYNTWLGLVLEVDVGLLLTATDDASITSAGHITRITTSKACQVRQIAICRVCATATWAVSGDSTATGEAKQCDPVCSVLQLSSVGNTLPMHVTVRCCVTEVSWHCMV